MLRLAEKAFAPGPLPFPLLHVDTTWKFQDMYRYRDKIEAELKGELIKYTNQEGVAMGMNPFDFGSKKYTDIMKTEALKQALTKYEFDCAFGGARRDEEKSRAKERIFSFRDSAPPMGPEESAPRALEHLQREDQEGRERPGLSVEQLDRARCLAVRLARGHSGCTAVFREAERPVVERSGTWILVDDDRMRLEEGEEPVR